MDIIKDISESNDRDILIQLDNYKSWLDHIKFFSDLRSKDLFFEHIVSDKPKTSKGCKCYLAYKGKLCGWVEIYSANKKGDNTIIKMFPYLNNVEGKVDVMPFTDQFRYFYNNAFDQ